MTKERLPAKLSHPRLFKALPRTRLFDVLDGECDRAIIWLSGLPGVGKTTLASTWLEHRGSHALWYRIDEDDADAATFFHHLTRLAAAHTRKRSLRLPVLTTEYLQELPGFARRYFASFFAALPADSTLVLDRWEAADAIVLNSLLDVAISELPEGQRLLVTSRAPPASSLMSWQTQGAMAHIDGSELRLTPNEARALAVDAPAVADLLHAHTDGWTAGFVLLLNHQRHIGELDIDELDHAASESLFAYFAHERFARSSDALRALLLRTALLPSFTRDEAMALTQSIDAPELLEQLYREHYFIDRDNATESHYRYHDLFRAFLLAQGRAQLDMALRNTLLVRAAVILSQAGRKEDALAACLEAGANEAAVGLLSELAPELLRTGRNAVIERAAGALPDTALSDFPWLAYWLGQARLPFDPPGARTLFEKAFGRFDAEDQVHPALLACSGVLESYFLEWGDMHGVDAWAVAFQRLSAREGAFPDAASEISCRLSLKALSYRRASYGVLMRQNVERLKNLVFETADAASRMVAINTLLWSFTENGHWLELSELIAHGDAALARLHHAPPSAHIIFNISKSAWFWQAGELQRSLEAIGRCRAIAESSGVHLLDRMVAGQGVYAALTARDLPLAERFIEAMGSVQGDARALDVAHLAWMRAAVALAHGDVGPGLALAHEVVRIAIACGADMPELQGNHLVILGMIASSREREAHEMLDAMIDRSDALGLSFLFHAALMIKADLLLTSGDAAAGLATLRRALEFGRAKGAWSIQPWAPWQILQRCCIAALRANIEVPYVTEMIKRQRLPAPDIDIPQWPWPIRIHTLGAFNVLRAGEPLRFQGKAQHKPLELLKSLIILGGSDVPQDQLIGMLWPEPPADGGQKVLEVTLHRLRALLGNNDMIRVSDRRVSLDRDQVWVDVFKVERLLNRPMAGDNQAESEDDARASARLLKLYAGELLAGEAEHPALLQRRHRLRNRFAQHVQRVGQRYQRAARWTDAAVIYQRAVELDPVAESFYREWMRCLTQLHLPAEAIAVYQRCRTMLSLLLGTKPTQDTEALRAQILAQTNSSNGTQSNR